MDFGGTDDYVNRGRFYRTQDRDCDFCDWSRGSVTVDRSDDVARCDQCHNDPETFDDGDQP